MLCGQTTDGVAAVIFHKKLSHLELSTAEWPMVEQLQDTLKPFKVATQALSTDTYPMASAVLPLQHVLVSQLSEPGASCARSTIKDVSGGHFFAFIS